MRAWCAWLRLLVPLVLLLALGVIIGQAAGTIERVSARAAAAIVADTPDGVGDQADGQDGPDVPALTAVALVALVVLRVASLAHRRVTAAAGDGTSSPFRSGGEPCRAPPASRLF